MASWGGHTLPGFFFLLFGLYEAFRISLQHFRKPAASSNGRRRCCFPCNQTTTIGIVKVLFTTIGIMIELFYPGAPMGSLHDSTTGMISLNEAGVKLTYIEGERCPLCA